MKSIEMLKEVQNMLNLNQRELGVYAGVPTRTVNSWMTGYRECPENVAELILRVAKSDRKLLDDGEEETSVMRRWCLVTSDGGDMFVTPCGSEADAIREGGIQWNHLLEKEQKAQETFAIWLLDIRICDRTIDGPFSWIGGDPAATSKDWLADRQ